MAKTGEVQRALRRDIKPGVSNRLWASAAGRCQMDGCNEWLLWSKATGDQVNVAEKAHIYAFADEGPRGNADIDKDALNSFENLILVCHPCHRAIDADKAGANYGAALLRSFKRQHEDRIRMVTGIHPGKKSLVLVYGANVGDVAALPSAQEAMAALFPKRVPVDERPVEIGLRNSLLSDRDREFFESEVKNLEVGFRNLVLSRPEDLQHISVFGLAPQPLLIRLGALLTDIRNVDVFPLRREPRGWHWDPDEVERVQFRVVRPEEKSGRPALVLSLSANVAHDRVKSVLGDCTAVWEVRLDAPHNDFLRQRGELVELRRVLRKLMDEIKLAHGQGAPLAILPAMPAAAAVEFGRIRAPKADMPWIVFDQQGERGFVEALRIG